MIASLLLFYTHAHAVFVLAVPVLYVLLEYGRPAAERPPGRQRWLRLELIVALGAAAWVGPFLARISAQQTSFWIARPSWPELFRTLSQYAGSTPALVVIAAAVVTETILGVAAVARHNTRVAAGVQDKPGLLLALWVTIPLLAPFLLSQVMTPFFLARASIASLPALHVVTARALGRLARAPLRRGCRPPRVRWRGTSRCPPGSSGGRPRPGWRPRLRPATWWPSTPATVSQASISTRGGPTSAVSPLDRTLQHPRLSRSFSPR